MPDGGGWDEVVAGIAEETSGGRSVPLSSWSAAGMDRLTLDLGGTRLEPHGQFLRRLHSVAARLPIDVDPLPLLSERAAIAGLRGRYGDRAGGTSSAQSVGGTAWIVAALDGWFCINLARLDDVEALPALLEADVDHRDWNRLLGLFAERSAEELDYRSMLLGMPASRVPPNDLAVDGSTDPQILHRHGQHLVSPFVVTDYGRASTIGKDDQPLVIDLTSLWAGPLCGALLASAGCRVIKVEGRRRPDGARSGPAAFFDLMNAGKECIALDFADRDDRLILDQLLAEADVVLEGSRPRVMDSLGVNPHDHVRRWQSCWVSITAFGRTGPWSNRVGFGDDVAAAAGVVARDGSGDSEKCPTFVGDAMADPVGGLVAATAAWHAICAKRSAVIDVALREAIGFVWGATELEPVAHDPVEPIQVRRSAVPSRAFDADGLQIRGELEA